MIHKIIQNFREKKKHDGGHTMSTMLGNGPQPPTSHILSFWLCLMSMKSKSKRIYDQTNLAEAAGKRRTKQQKVASISRRMPESAQLLLLLLSQTVCEDHKKKKMHLLLNLLFYLSPLLYRPHH